MRTFSRMSWTLFALLMAVAAIAGPKNVIIMIGDGMGPDIVQATGAYKYGTAYHDFGGDQRLAMETLANHCYALTYSAEGKGYDFTWAGGKREYPMADPTDSAAAATALATGVKTYNKAIGVDLQRNPLVNVLQRAQAAGRKTGVITSVPFCHATPAGFSAHNTNRDDYTGIAHEMLFVTQPDVVMGAGNPDAATDPAKAYTYMKREDWDAVKAGKTPYRLVQTREEFQQLAATPSPTPVLGLFRNQNCLVYRNADGKAADATLPTLAEMTSGTLNTLQNPNGFFLMVEGGAIDWCGHANDLTGAIGETLAFDDAIDVVLKWVAAHGGWDDNLFIITADHDTGYLNGVKPTEANTLPTVTWGTTGKWGSHTNRPVSVYYQGNGSAQLAANMLTVNDFGRGPITVVNNTDLAHLMFSAFPAPKAIKVAF